MQRLGNFDRRVLFERHGEQGLAWAKSINLQIKPPKSADKAT